MKKDVSYTYMSYKTIYIYLSLFVFVSKVNIFSLYKDNMHLLIYDLSRWRMVHLIRPAQPLGPFQRSYTLAVKPGPNSITLGPSRGKMRVQCVVPIAKKYD